MTRTRATRRPGRATRGPAAHRPAQTARPPGQQADRPPATPRQRRTARSLPNASLTAAGWAVGAAVTALVLWTPVLDFEYRNASLHLVLDSVDACVALLAAYLVHGRYVRGRRVQDLLLAQGLALLAVAGLGLPHLVDVLGIAHEDTLGVWLQLTVRVVGAVLIGAAALVGGRARLGTARRRWSVSGPLALLALALLAMWAMGPQLPAPLQQGPAAGAAVSGHQVLVGAQVLSALCFAVASVAFTAQAARRDDELLRWLGPACALAGLARAHYAVNPTLYTDWLYTGDLLRTGFYLLLLVGAARELRQYWTGQTRAAVLEDRRRLARELHDGVLQELAYIGAASHALPDDAPARQEITGACQRALDEARAALHALGRGGDEPLGFVLHRAAREMSERHRVALEVDLDDSVEADAEQRHALARISREAIANAARHGEASRVCLRLAADHGVRELVIEDDGTGFDVEASTQGPGYGLVSMRERARALPGRLQLCSDPGAGAVVRVTW